MFYTYLFIEKSPNPSNRIGAFLFLSLFFFWLWRSSYLSLLTRLLVHLRLGLLQDIQCLLESLLGLTDALEGAVDMIDELIEYLIGIRIRIILQLGRISLRAGHDFFFLLLRLLKDGLCLFLGLLHDLILVRDAFRIFFSPLPDLFCFLFGLMNDLVMIAHDLIGAIEFLRQVVAQFLHIMDQIIIIDEGFFRKWEM